MESCLSQVTRIDEGVDWSEPWLIPFRNLGIEIAAAPDWRAALNSEARARRIHNHAHHPLQFIPQHELPDGISYEAFISATGRVPTRENLHDFFNALVWLTYPNIKIQLNALQAKQIEKLGVGKARGVARDAATLFDENAAFLAVSTTFEGRAIVHNLKAHQWSNLFVHQREQFTEHAAVFLFGHAIMEKLVRPYKAITAHTLVCWVGPHFHQLNAAQKREELDQQMAGLLRSGAEELLPTAFSPLPVLGLPGWWSSQTAEFYADTDVFRPVREKKENKGSLKLHERSSEKAG